MAEDGTDAHGATSATGATDATGATGATDGTRRPPDRRGVARSTVLVAGAFVLGIVAGAVLLGLLMESPPRDLVERDGVAAAPTGPATDRGASAEIAVNEACLGVINATQDTVQAIEDLGDSVAELDLTGLDDVVRRLQPLQDQLQGDLARCRVDTTLGEDGTSAGTSAGETSDEPAGTSEEAPEDSPTPASPTG